MKNHIIAFALHLADNALILGHRNSEWCGHGPVLEQDIAITNIALDLIGQSRLLYQYTASLINQQPGKTETEDSLAYTRDVRCFKNFVITEQPNNDWAHTVLRQFYYSAFQYYLFEKLMQCNNNSLAAIAEKSLKEISYHLQWSSEWVIRLGDGTDESNARIIKAIENLHRHTAEFFIATDFEKYTQEKFNYNLLTIKKLWNKKIADVFKEATLEKSLPVNNSNTGLAGKNGLHSEALGYILAEMQYLQKTYPGCHW